MALMQPESEKSEMEKDSEAILLEDYSNLVSTFPKKEGWAQPIVPYRNFWFKPQLLKNIMLVREHFKPRCDDTILVSHPKCGTTWLKALAFTIVNRSRYTFAEHPLLNINPHQCVPSLEIRKPPESILGYLDSLPSPRLLSSHMPLSLMPPSMTNLGCRFVYMCREPKDVFVSRWHFEKRLSEEPILELDQLFDMFCEGASPYGPFWDHYLEYWNGSLARPQNILFLRYEDMVCNPINTVKRLAEFLGLPFTEEEHKKGVVEEVVRLCSFEKLKGLEVNQIGESTDHVEGKLKFSAFFRAGKVGDWKNHLSDEMTKKLDQVVQEKIGGSGLTFLNLDANF